MGETLNHAAEPIQRARHVLAVLIQLERMIGLLTFHIETHGPALDTDAVNELTISLVALRVAIQIVEHDNKL